MGRNVFVIKQFVVVLLATLAGCAGLSEKDLVQISTGSPTVSLVMETLSAESGADMQRYSKKQFALVMPRKTIGIERFRPMLRLTCERVYKGELQTLGKSQLMVGMNVPPSRIKQLAGRTGPVESYLGQFLERSMSGYVVDEHRKIELAIALKNPKMKRMIPLSKAVCVSYKQGIIDIHYSAVMLSEESKKGKAPAYWAITDGRAYAAGLNKEIKKARISAEKAMRNEKEQVAYYSGATRWQNVIAALSLAKSKGYNEDYDLAFTLTNDGEHPYLFGMGSVDTFKTADETNYQFKFKQVSPYGDQGTCAFDRVSGAFSVGPGTECIVQLKAEITDFSTPDMPLIFEKGYLSMKLKPVSVYESKHGLTQL